MSDHSLLRETRERNLAGALAKLAEFKAQLRSGVAKGGTTSEERLAVLEQRIADAQARLLALGHDEANLDEKFASETEESWRALEDALEDTISTFEGQH